MTDETYVDVTEASRITGIKERTLYELAREGRCPSVKVPGTRMVRFPRGRLLAWLEGRLEETVADGDGGD